MNKKGELFWILVVFIAVSIFSIILYNILYAFTSGSETITIKEKWVKYQGKGAKYLVSSINNEVFEITDSWIKWRWNSSDLYAKIQPNQVCSITTQGWRFPFLSDYKNILTAECK